MKRVLVCTVLLACFASQAMAAQTVWQGDLFITEVNNASLCNAVNMKVGEFARFVLRPKSAPDNGTTDLLSWTFPRAAGQLVPTPNGTSLDAATQAIVRSISGSAGFSQRNSAINATLSPAAPVAQSIVTISIVINNFLSNQAPSPASGCHVTFEGALIKRPG
jgi:hypothetical protein